MCDGGSVPSAGAGALVVPVDLGAYTGERIPLEPVERVSITTVVDNVCDVLAAETLWPMSGAGVSWC
jgi:hypothetical protein